MLEIKKVIIYNQTNRNEATQCRTINVNVRWYQPT